METHLLSDLAIVMMAAALMTLLCHRFKQPVVIGYLLAGLLIGPYTPPFSLVHDLHSIHTMAELGLVFLLFSLGLEFNLPKIRRVGVSAGLAALLEVVCMLVIGFFLGQAFGWTRYDSIFLGAILSMSSTTIIVKVFMDFKMMHEHFVQIVFGILVLEDIVAIAILSILSGLGTHGGTSAVTVFSSFGRIGLFVVIFLLLGLVTVPRLMSKVASFKSKEVLGIVTLALCLAGSMLAGAFDLSVALGAFLSGAVLAASQEINDIEEWIHPVRDMFSAIFFVSAGMLIQPHLLWQYKGPILIITMITLIGKVFSGTVGCFLAGYDLKTSTRVGMSLAQIGEFSFVIASLGLSLKVTSEFLYPLAIMVSSLTTLATPYLIRNSDYLVGKFLTVMPTSIHTQLDNYHSWMERAKQKQTHTFASTVFSKYLLRLGSYLVVFCAGILLMKSLSVTTESTELEGSVQSANWTLIGMWMAVGLIALPLLGIVSKYASHIILLLTTRSKYLLHMINVHSFYSFVNAAVLFLLQIIFLSAASAYVRQPYIWVMAAILISMNFLLKKHISWGREWLESILDQVTGLATSEPTRQAILRSSDGTVRLVDITDQFTVKTGSIADKKTIRELGLREKSGATIVAIYRSGQHIANPGPDQLLLQDDVLILLGNDQELKKAKDWLSN